MKTPRILHAESSPTLRAMYRKVLAQYGYTVKEVGDCNRLLGVLNQEKFDLLILDPAIFGADGPRSMHQVTELFQSSRIVIFTNNSSQDWMEAADLHGVTEYYIKGQITTNSLLTRIEEIMEWAENASPLH